MSKIFVERPASATQKPALSSNWNMLQKILKRKSDDSSTQPDSQQQKQPEKRIKKDLKSTSSPNIQIIPKKASARIPVGSSTTKTKIKKAHKSSAMESDGTKSASTIKSKTAVKSTVLKSDGIKTPTSASLALWAEDNDISTSDLVQAYGVSPKSTELPVSAMQSLELNNLKKTEIGKYVAIDCEMVGVGGPVDERSVLARVSIVNFHGHCVLDVFVRPQERVTDWRTWVSGVSAKDMVNAVDFPTAQKMVSDILQDRILIGHAIRHDLGVLLLSQSHPRRDIRDTSKHPEFRKLSKGKTPGLKRLAKEILGIDIQGGEHSSVEDARACMLLFRRHKAEFDRHHEIQYPNKTRPQANGKSKGGKKKTAKRAPEDSKQAKVDVKDEAYTNNVSQFLEI